MAKQRQFNIVLVNPDTGTGIKPSEKMYKAVKYNGNQMVIKMK